MKKILITCISLMPAISAAAVDVSDCTVIGHERGILTMENCTTADSCERHRPEFPEAYTQCMRSVQTPAECELFIEQQNKKIETENLVYRCPANAERLAKRAKEKTSYNSHLVDMENMPLDQDALIADTENVYLIRYSVPSMGILVKGEFKVLGPADSDGLNQALYVD